VDALGLKTLVKDLVDTDEVAVYNILFLVRSKSDKLHYHLDWADKLGTNAMTFLIPLNNFTVHMKYYDEDDEVRRYKYKYGKAVGFGGGFWHSLSSISFYGCPITCIRFAHTCIARFLSSCTHPRRILCSRAKPNCCDIHPYFPFLWCIQ